MQRRTKFLKGAWRIILRLFSWVVIIGAALLALFLSADLLYSTFSRDLRPWHTSLLKNEFKARDAKRISTFADYLANEAELFAEVDRLKAQHFDPQLDSALSRFNPAGSPLQARLDRDWNRSFKIEASPERAVALLVHGLTDSPYSMRSTALSLAEKGITVYGLRLPGHGTIPAGLDQIEWQDWIAAVDLAMREVSARSAGKPYYVFGYSTGSALLIKHVADTVMSRGGAALPRMIFLYSPALGVTPFARLANVQRLVTWFGVFKKARWSNVDLEIDPHKYQSFAKNGGAQISELLQAVYASLKGLEQAGAAGRFPPVVSFQSAVDETVNATDLIARLYGVVSNTQSELVFFTLNRSSGLEPFLRFSPQALIDAFNSLRRQNFRLTLVRNAAPDSLEVIERTYAPEAQDNRRRDLLSSENYEDRPLALSWPADIFSLSHVAVPFPPDDPVYGYAAYTEGKKLVNLGSLQMRGEKGVLMISAADQLRLRANPFHAYMIEKIVTKILGDLGSVAERDGVN